MTTSVFRGDFFKIISDGDKIVLLRDNGEKRECYMLENPYLTQWNIKMFDPCSRYQDFGGIEYFCHGLREVTIDLSLQGGEIKCIDKPLIMGVDIFNRLSITDYLDIINEKIKRR